jgi:membrane fusion protein, copper/silver efflux system
MIIQIPTHFKRLSAVLTLVLAATFLSMVSCKKPEESSSSTQYTCSMHPEVVQNGPGKCPKCNMDLVEKK